MTTPEGINSDEALLRGVEIALAERKKFRLENMVGDLAFIVVNVEEASLQSAANETLATTGYVGQAAFQDAAGKSCVFSLPKGRSADILIRARPESAHSPFAGRVGVKSAVLPNTRLETYVFAVTDLDAYVARQKERGGAFLTDGPVPFGRGRFIQTLPSNFTGNSLGFIEWPDKSAGPERYALPDASPLATDLAKPGHPWLAGLGRLDHAATRLRAEDRDAAILEFMAYTNYDFAFAVFVESMNSITNVARLNPDDFAMVFTSGIRFGAKPEDGPTEAFVHNYGQRTHHLAFEADPIETVVEGLKSIGVGFLGELVGSPEEGLKQIFTKPMPATLLVNEYIQRYGGFDGFFTASNVTLLTASTLNQ